MLRVLQVSIAATKVGDQPSPDDPRMGSELARLFEEYPNDLRAVGEQDHLSYIIHLSNEPEAIWSAVGPKTSICVELRERHKRMGT